MPHNEENTGFNGITEQERLFKVRSIGFFQFMSSYTLAFGKYVHRYSPICDAKTKGQTLEQLYDVYLDFIASTKD